MQPSDRPKLITWLSLLASIMVFGWAAPGRSQVVPDATLGNGNNSSVNVNGIRTDVNGGLRRGSSLFHSFDRFNIPTNFQVYFGNPAGIRNIFSRVTGRGISNIDGVLGVAGAANLYFMNPNGIIFGPNARLDISGSFFATTANAIEFPDNQRFSASGDRTVPLVEVNIPIGLQFGANPPAMLTSRGVLNAGQDLTLAAGNLDLQGQVQAGRNLTLNATDTVRIRDTTTEPFLARSGGNMTIQGNQSIDILALNHPATPFQSGRNLTLASNGSISTDAHFYAGGNFSVRTLFGEPGNFLSLYDPIISANGDVTFNNYVGPALKVEATGSIIINGDITITGPDTTLSQSATFGNFAPGLGTLWGTLNNGVGSVTAASLENSLGLVSGTLSGTPFNNGTATEGSAVTTRFNASVGDTITFNWNFSTNEGAGSVFNDFSFSTLRLIGAAPTATELADTTPPLSAPPLAGFSGSRTGAQTLTIPTAGTYVLGVGVVDVRDTAINSGLQISNLQLNGTPLNITPSTDPDIQILASSPALILKAGVTTLLNAPSTFPTTAGTPPTTFISTTPATAPATISVGNISTASTTNSGGLALLNAPGDITIRGGISASSITGNGGTVNVDSTGGNIAIGTLRSVTNKTPTAINTSSQNGSGGDVLLNAAGTVTLNNLDILTDTNGSGRAGDIAITSNSANPTAIALVDATLSAGIGNSSSNLDTQIFLFDTNGNPLTGISSNDDSSILQGSGGSLGLFGSTLTRDSYLPYSFTTPGDYVIGVGGFFSSATLPGTNNPLTGNRLSSGTYALQVSIPDAPVLPGRVPEIVPKAEPNDAIPTAQNINDSFAIGFNPNIENSNTIPYVSIAGSGNNTYDYYRFTIPSTASAANPITAIFDIDTGAGGIAGAINLSAPGGITFTNSQIDASTFGRGNSGDITIQTGAQLALTGSSIRTTVGQNAEGSGGDINIAANQVNLSDGSGLDTGNEGRGIGGSIQVTSNSVTLANNSGIRATVGENGTGNGGLIQINTQTLEATGGSRLEAQTLGTQTGGVGAQAGNITVIATGNVGFSGFNQVGAPSGIFTSTEGTNSGLGGNISVQADNLTIADRAVLSARTNNSAKGGDIRVDVNSLDMLNGGQLITSATAASTANAGSITVNARDRAQIAGIANPFIALVSPFVGVANIQPLTGFITCTPASCAPDVEAPDRIPFVPTNATSDGNFTYYSFSVRTAGSRGIFDIDNTTGTNDTQLFLFNRATGELVARNDDAPTTAGAGGSTSSLNSYLRVNFPTSGEYLLGVASFYTYPADYDATAGLIGPLPIAGNPGTPIPAGSTYTLQVSLQAEGVPAGQIPNQGLNSGLFAQAEGTGNAGNLTITAPQLRITDGGRVVASATSGTSSTVTLQGNETGQATLSNGAQVSVSTVSGQGGNILVSGFRDLQLNSSEIVATTETGQAGSLDVSAVSLITLNNNSVLSVAATGQTAGNSGNVTLTTPQLSVNNSQISASTIGGVGGNVTLQGLNSLQMDNGQVSATTETGRAGNLSVNASNAIALNNNSVLSVGATGLTGNSGGVTLTTPQLTVNNSLIEASTIGGVGGSINLQGLSTLQMDNGQVSATTETGRAGNLSVNASSAIALNNSSLSVEATGQTGNSGNVTLTTPQLTVNNSLIEAATLGGVGGSINLQGLSTLQLDNAQIAASTQTGRAGNLSVSASTAIALNNSSLSVEATGQTGDSGNVTLTTPQLSVNNSQISASTVGGVGGDVTLQGLNSLQMNNGQVSASTQTGQAGDLNVNVNGDINLTNNSRLAVEATGANGVAGDVTINGRNITLQNSEVLASSRQGRSGNIRITGRRLDLQNGTIKAETGQSTGARSGSIDLNLSFRLTLEDESEISTLGLNGADGGDITILNVRFLFGKPPTGPDGSDIVGRADGGGRGGQVRLDRITLVQGFSFRRAEPGNRTNDIDTNGQLVNLSTNADVGARGLATPLVVFNDVSRIVTSACEAVGLKPTEGNAELKVTGRGGVPISPSAPLPAQAPGSDWVTLELAPQVPVSIALPNGTTAILKPGEIYEIQATCVNAWKLRQRSLL